MTYVPPKPLREWRFDDPARELYQLLVMDDQTVCSAFGRYAHSSGATACSWSDFVAGALDDVVTGAHGANVLTEAREFVAAKLGEVSASDR